MDILCIATVKFWSRWNPIVNLPKVPFKVRCKQLSQRAAATNPESTASTANIIEWVQGYKVDIKPRFPAYVKPAENTVEFRILRRSGYSQPLDHKARENFALLARDNLEKRKRLQVYRLSEVVKVVWPHIKRLYAADLSQQRHYANLHPR